jgi:5-oxoprolinase (ATP-hydrolysing)
MVRLNRFLVDTIVTCEGERHDTDPPWGIFGGHEGLNASMTKNPGRPGEEAWPSKVTAFRLAAGDTLEVKVPNSGGYGDPLERDPELVLSDVLDGFTTAELAERDYGVLLDVDSLAVDVEGTARLRAQTMAERDERAKM